MIPLRDSIRSHSRPLMIYGIITACTLVFLHELSLGPAVPRFFDDYGLIARRFWSADSLSDRVVPLITSMFIHAGWIHFLGNMLFLWVFGDNVEDRMGRLRFALFYLVTGALASLAQLLLYPNSPVPMIGASGAIAAVLGAYFRLFPRARVLALVPIFFFLQIVEVRAGIFLVFWFGMQLLSGTATLLSGSGALGGTAFWVHIGGFVAGYLLCRFFIKRPRVEVLPPW